VLRFCDETNNDAEYGFQKRSGRETDLITQHGKDDPNLAMI
jgi:hypothetical protein